MTLRLGFACVPLLGTLLTVLPFAPGVRAAQESPLLDCERAVWKTTFQDATAAGLDPSAIVLSVDSSTATTRVEGDQTVVTGVGTYDPTPTRSDEFPARYECRFDRRTGSLASVTYAAIDGNGDDIATPPTELAKTGYILKACVARLESDMDDQVRKRGMSSRADVEIALADVAQVAKGKEIELQGRGRGKYGEAFDWQVLIFTCRYDPKRDRISRATHALETPSLTGALPADTRDAIDACRTAVGVEVLREAHQRGYRQLRRVEVELPELANVTPRDGRLDVSGRGQFRLDNRHNQPTPLTFTCTYDPRAGDVVTASFKAEAGSWTPSGEIANGLTGSLRCGSARTARDECRASIRGNVRVVREFGSVKCEAYRNWMWDSTTIRVWDGCAAEFEFDARP